MPIPKDTTQFLNHLWADTDLPTGSHFTFTAIHPDRHHPTPSRHITCDDSQILNSTLNDLLTANQQGWGAFIAIAARKPGLDRWQRGGATDLLALPALFVDIDRPPMEALQNLKQIHIPPSCFVSSGRGMHAYWFLRPATRDLRTAQLILSRLARLCGGDVLSASQSMRLPGSHNNRRDKPCRLAGLHPDRLYTLGDFAEYNIPKPATRSSNQSIHVPVTAPSRLQPDLIAAISERLITNYEGYFRENGWIASLCPAGHKRDQPGQHFYFNPQRGMGHCFGRHGRLLLRDLCPLLGIPLGHDFYLTG